MLTRLVVMLVRFVPLTLFASLAVAVPAAGASEHLDVRVRRSINPNAQKPKTKPGIVLGQVLRQRLVGLLSSAKGGSVRNVLSAGSSRGIDASLNALSRAQGSVSARGLLGGVGIRGVGTGAGGGSRWGGLVGAGRARARGVSMGRVSATTCDPVLATQARLRVRYAVVACLRSNSAKLATGTPLRLRFELEPEPQSRYARLGAVVVDGVSRDVDACIERSFRRIRVVTQRPGTSSPCAIDVDFSIR